MKKTYHSRGAALIAQERIEQVVKHGFDEKNDADYRNGELLSAAGSVLTLCRVQPKNVPDRLKELSFDVAKLAWPWKSDFGQKHFDKLTRKDVVGRLAVVGAFAAAEIDRILPEETPEEREERETLEKYQVAEAFKALLRDDPEYATNFRDRITVCMVQVIQELRSRGESADDWFHFVGQAGAEKFINIFTDGPVEPTKKEDNGTPTGI